MAGHPAVVWALRLAVLGLFVVTILAGLLGDPNPYRNIAPTLVWIIWWVGLAYVPAFVGDVWRLVNPWRTVFDAADWLYRRLGGGSGLGWRRPYPQALGVWPACALLLAFCWTELVYPNAAVPAHIAWLAIAYSVLTWAGMLVFGRDVWLQHGEMFSLVFGTFARFAPTEARDGRLLLRPPGAGLLDDRPVSTSMMAFVLLLLATVLYDGLIGTGEWAELEGALRSRLPGSGETSGMVIKTVGLAAFWGLFLGAYLGICAVMSWVASGRPAPLEIARSFALTLVPIAIGYHVAHYLVFLLVQGQYIIPLISDPFGCGWNLFGTAGYRVDIAVAGARLAWYAAVAAIVTGHVTAVYLAHVRALGVFEPHRVALATQVPLTALMVLYTFIGLSITAEPIVESRAATEPSAVASEAIAVPPDAVHFRQQDSRLASSGPDMSARVKLTYKMLGSAFHDATKTSVADLLYAYVFAYRWSARGAGGDAHYDPFIDAATAPLRRHLVAVRAVGVDTGSKSFRVGDVNFVREVFTIEVYLDIAADDAEWNAVVAPPWSTLPWHVLALMEEAVTRGWAAFSQVEATRRGVPWLDLVRSGEMNAKLASLLPQLEREAFRPQALRGPRHRGGGAPAVGGAGGVLQGQRPFPGDQRALQAQELDAAERDAGGISRPHLSAGRGLLRRLRHSAPRVYHESGMERRAPDPLRRHRGDREVPAQLSRGAHPPEVRSRHGSETRRAGMPLRGDRRGRARRSRRSRAARRRCQFPGRPEGPPAAGALHPIGAHSRQRQRDECRSASKPIRYFAATLSHRAPIGAGRSPSTAACAVDAGTRGLAPRQEECLAPECAEPKRG